MNQTARILAVPIDALTTPRDGDTYTNRYWAVAPSGALFYQSAGNRGWSPQCNANRAAVHQLIERLYPDANSLHIPIAYLGRWDQEWGHTLPWANTDWINEPTP